MSSSERRIQSELMLAASDAGLTVWRNNTGQAWAGQAERLPDGSVLIRNPRPLRAGLCKGSSDLIGLRRVTVGPTDVGRTIAQFAAVEVKAARGRVSADQRNFLDFVRDAGGFALVARAPDDLRLGEPS